MNKTIHIAAAILSGEDGKILLVRKRGTTAFMQAGGKIEAGEQPVETLRRELAEELGLSLQEDDAHYLGKFSAQAANEPGHLVVADIFHLNLDPDCAVHPAAEIEEICWVTPENALKMTLAPLTRDHILPALATFRKNKRQSVR